MEPKVNRKKPTQIDLKTTPDADKSLKGTFISVLILGAFIILSWAGVYFIFLSRL